MNQAVMSAALKAYRAAKAQFMISDEDASRMIAQAVVDSLSNREDGADASRVGMSDVANVMRHDGKFGF